MTRNRHSSGIFVAVLALLAGFAFLLAGSLSGMAPGTGELDPMLGPSAWVLILGLGAPAAAAAILYLWATGRRY